MSSRHVNFVVEPELWENIQSAASTQGVTVSELLRTILRVHFSDEAALQDSATIEAHRAAYATAMKALNQAYAQTVGVVTREYQERLARRKELANK